MPFVDLGTPTAGSNSLVAVWAVTDNYVTPGTSVGVSFPPDLTVPASVNMSTCTCVFIRNTQDNTGTWATSDVTVTSGAFFSATNSAVVNLPAALYPGKFYIRFDNSAGLYLPSTTGTATVALTDPSSNVTLSKAFYVRPTFTAATTMGFISGSVVYSTGVSVAAATVMATNYGSYPPVSLSARRAWLNPIGTTPNAYTTTTGGNGSYTLSVPPGTYSMQVEVWNYKNSVANSTTATASGVSVSDGATVTKNFLNLGPLP
jgi:hypothetical protein